MCIDSGEHVKYSEVAPLISESDLKTAGHTLAGVAPTTTQGTKPCTGCKHALESGDPNRSSFSKCHLCKRTHKDYFERTALPVA
jgi:hypothetical protein